MSTPRYRWQPTTAEIAARYGLRTEDVIRFDHNTSPFRTDWAPASIGRTAQGLNEYPGASYARLRQAAGSYIGVEPDWIVPGAGIDELILLVAKAFLSPRSRACAAVPTYPLYEIASLQAGSEFLAIDHEPPHFGFPVEEMGQSAETSEVTWLCVPNNPTGIRISDQDIDHIVKVAKGLVVIDAAYAEFSHDSWAEYVSEHPHVIVLHTLSKAFGLAAIRVGYAVAHPKVVAELDGVRPPGSISTISAALGEDVLREPQRMRRHVARIEKERLRFSDALRGLGIGVLDADRTNFVLCEVGDEAHRLAEELMTEGLVVRSFTSSESLSSFLRFTVRTPDENARLLDALARRRG